MSHLLARQAIEARTALFQCAESSRVQAELEQQLQQDLLEVHERLARCGVLLEVEGGNDE